ncbi:hypothetical protein [Spirosoma flavum]|uniref:Uncharacterized protein n=1 Tax=Spirosoma flavum TaxID=2048557 RepID=A0ABW6AUJ9_9BACT
MCILVFLPDGEYIEGMDELEAVFGLPVDAFHEGQIKTKNQCLCHVNVGSYLEAVGATWWPSFDGTGDYCIETMRAIHLY